MFELVNENSAIVKKLACLLFNLASYHRKFVNQDLTPGCLQLLEILEISWNLNGPPGNFRVMIKNFILWLMALLHDDVALFVH